MMRRPASINALETLGRVRLSTNFFMRDFLYSEISNWAGISNVPDNPDLAIETGTRLCEDLLEPIQARFGRIAIRSAYRSPAVNAYGNREGHNCARNEANRAGHIWDQVDGQGRKGATACIVVPWFADRYEKGADWQSLAWWIHDNLPYSSLEFFAVRAAFNIQWREDPERRINSWISARRTLTRRGMDNWEGCHSEAYSWFDSVDMTEITQ